MGRARALRRFWAVLGGPGGSAHPTGALVAQGRAAAQRRRDPGEGEPDGALELQARPLLPNPFEQDGRFIEAKEPCRGGRHSGLLCLGRRREF